VKFVDASKLIKFDRHGKILEKTYSNIKNVLIKHKRIIVPGFYGSDKFGKIKIMSRGGSDITGAICAKAVGGIYENWTDVNGFFDCLANKNVIENISWDSVEFLSTFGASVIHSKCARISSDNVTIIKNTFDPSAQGTQISKDGPEPLFAHATKEAVELWIKDGAIERKLIKNLKAEILYSQTLLGETRIGLMVSEGYSNKKIFRSLCKMSRNTRSVIIHAYIMSDEEKICEIKNEHKNAHIMIKRENKWIFVESICLKNFDQKCLQDIEDHC